MEELADAVAPMRYDAVKEFLQHLARRLLTDSEADAGRGRKKLSQALHTTGKLVYYSAEHLHAAWLICRPFMKEDDG